MSSLSHERGVPTYENTFIQTSPFYLSMGGRRKPGVDASWWSRHEIDQLVLSWHRHLERRS